MADIIKRTSQYIDNLSFDETYQEATVLPVVEDGGVLVRQPKIATEETLRNINEFSIPSFDTQVIDESLAPATTTITYKLNAATVAK